MKHPHIDFRLPPSFVALLDWLLQGYDEDSGLQPYDHAEEKTRGCLYAISAFLTAARAGVAIEHGAIEERELRYDNHPLEVIPFAHNGGDGLVYAWALLAPELDARELPCVSFAPVDEHAVWLGDDTKSAIETMLIGYAVDCGGSVDQQKRSALCQALGLTPDDTRTDVTAGARVNRRLAPHLPAGFRYESTDDGIGVLAPASAFAPGPFDKGAIEDEAETLARSFLDRKLPASALVVLKQGYFEESLRPLIELQRDAFAMLGRPALVHRAERWLAFHGA